MRTKWLVLFLLAAALVTTGTPPHGSPAENDTSNSAAHASSSSQGGSADRESPEVRKAVASDEVPLLTAASVSADGDPIQARRGPSDASPLESAQDAPEALELRENGVIYRGVSSPLRFDVSPPLSQINPILPRGDELPREILDRPSGLEGPLGPQSVDPVVQATVGGGRAEAMPAPIVSFDGPSNLSSVSPPDPVGDVGPNHYVAMSNLSFQIFDKSGTSLYGPALNNTLWAGFGGPCETENAGDPIVLYDQLADRWILSQFTAAGPTYCNCLAVSQTPDPTGSYYRYAISTGTNFPDYPKLGIWPDALYISNREFAGSTFSGVGAYAVNRSQLLAGDPTPQVISFLVTPSPAYNVGDGLLPSDLDGTALPPAGAPNYFVGSMDDGGPYGAPQDALTLWKFHADFATPANSTFTLTDTIPTAPFDSMPAFCSGRACVPQPGTANKVDHLGYRQRPLHRLAYRNFGTHEALVTNQSVEASATMSGIRWWEIRSPDSTPVLYQEGTYAPGISDGIHRWMGSIAMDGSGNMALGYSASDGSSTYPSLLYTGRLALDPLGTMPQGEGSIVAGTGSQTGSNRWGDYTSINIDPTDDCTFWYVNEYVPATSSVGWRLRVGSFRFPGCTGSPGPSGTLQGTVTNASTSAPIVGASVTVTDGVYTNTATTVAGGTYGLMIPPGTYSVTASAPMFTPAMASGVVVIVGATTTQDFALVGQPSIASGGSSLVAEGCAPPNGVPDPGETVTVALSLQNNGTAPTTDLVATLQATGGVTSPGAPQSYGSIAVGGSASRDFTFTADPLLPCGGTVTATLQLQDGATSLGTVAFSFQTGVLQITFSEGFDGGVAPALPAGWVATVAQGTVAAWATSATAPYSAPNAAFTADPSTASDNRLDTPSIPISSAGAQLTFRNSYNMEGTTTAFDGCVLEISIGGGAFQDILAAGGSFVAGGYNKTISSSFGNPLAGRQAWGSNSGGYIVTTVNLPAAADGQNIVLRFRMGSDTSVAATGWRIDDISISGAYLCCECPTITLAPANLPAGVVGATYGQTLTASGGTGPYVFAVGSGALPAGLTLSSDGTLTGTPTSTGTFDFAVTAVDSNGCTGSLAYSITVACPAVALSPATLPGGTVGVVYSQPVAASGGVAPYTYAVTAGALPGGLTLTSGGLLSGTPAAAGLSTFTVTATDAYGCSGGLAYSLNICPVLTLSPAALGAGLVGSPYSQALTASGGTPPYTYAVTAGALPGGLTLAPEGTLSGTPSAAGAFTFTITATDGNGCSGSRTYTLVVSAFDLSFYDDYGRSALCVNSATGAFTYKVLYGFGVGTYAGVGVVTRYNGTLYLKTSATSPAVLSLTYMERYRKASASFKFSPMRISSALYDNNTQNNPPGC